MTLKSRRVQSSSNAHKAFKLQPAERYNKLRLLNIWQETSAACQKKKNVLVRQCRISLYEVHKDANYFLLQITSKQIYWLIRSRGTHGNCLVLLCWDEIYRLDKAKEYSRFKQGWPIRWHPKPILICPLQAHWEMLQLGRRFYRVAMLVCYMQNKLSSNCFYKIRTDAPTHNTYNFLIKMSWCELWQGKMTGVVELHFYYLP